jgi:phage terminase large subunit-like protein
VAIVRASWNRAFLDELRDFPAGRKDDQVDAFSRAFNGLTSKRSGNKISSDELLRLGIRI